MTSTAVIPQISRERLTGLDLLRTIAIFMVVVWHLPLSLFPFRWKPATWAGVDLFFVLSGYLIGSQLLRPYTRQTEPSYLDFLLRRALRVLPAYLTVVLAYFLIPAFRERPTISPWWKFLTFTQNFDLNPEKTGSFSHAWSLCVEEHFYFILPLIVYGLMRKPSFNRVALFAGFVVLFGLIARSLLWIHFIQPLDHDDPQLQSLFLEYIYYPTYTRLDGLLVGVLLAATRLFRPAWWQRVVFHSNALFCAGIAVLIGAFWVCQSMFSFATAMIGYPLLAMGFGLLVMACLSPRSILSRRRFFGATTGATLAYSIYLTHKEVMHLDHKYLSRWIPLNGIVGWSVYLGSFLIVAGLLYFCIERPGLRLRDRLLANYPTEHPSLA